MAIASFLNVADDVVNYTVLSGSDDVMAIADFKAEDRPRLTDAGKVHQLIEQAGGLLRAAGKEIESQLEPSGVFEPIRSKRKVEELRKPKRELLKRLISNQYRIKFADQVEDFHDQLRELLNVSRGPMRYALDLEKIFTDDGPFLDQVDLALLQQLAPSNEELTREWHAQTDRRRQAKRVRPSETEPVKHD